MVQTTATETLPEITSIDTGKGAVSHVSDVSRLNQEKPTVVVHFDTGAKIAYAAIGGHDTVDVIWYHPLCPDTAIHRYVLPDIPEPEGVYGEAMKWVAEYLDLPNQDELYDQLGEREANILLGRKVMTNLDVFE